MRRLAGEEVGDALAPGDVAVAFDDGVAWPRSRASSGKSVAWMPP
jgi:hypothetical protein